MKKFFSGLALLTAVIALASCEEDIFGWGDKHTYGENEIVFTIGGKKGTNTRSNSDVAHTIVAPSNVIDLPCKEGEPRLSLIETVTEMDEDFFDAVSGTRGTPVYTQNFDQVYANQLYGTAYVPKDGKAEDSGEGESVVTPVEYTASEVWGSYLEGNGTVPFKKVSGKDYTYSYDYSTGQTTNLAWPEGNTLRFFLQAPDMSSMTSVTGLTRYSDGSVSFSYTSPTNATDQKDLLFGSRDIAKATKDTKNEILLYHALTAVKFKAGTSDLIKNLGMKITGIDINLVYKGSCTVTPNPTYDYSTFSQDNKIEVAPDKTKSADCVKWNLDYAKTADLSVTFPLDGDGNQQLVGSDDDETQTTLTFPESFYHQTTGAKGTIADHNLNDANYSKTFMVIPQYISQDVTTAAGTTKVETVITVYYQMSGMTEPASKTITLPADEWKAGQLRTFTIDALYVDVEIDDEASEEGVKTDLAMTNSGTATQYQRAMLTANWVYYDDKYGNVISDVYPIVTEGYVDIANFENFPGEGWVLGSDGFFYYTKPVQAGNEPAVPLFTKFTQPESKPEQAHLEMSICVQAVKYEAERQSIGSYWRIVPNGGVTVDELVPDATYPNKLIRVPNTRNYLYNNLSTVPEVPEEPADTED